jgi:hypothetical protein
MRTERHHQNKEGSDNYNITVEKTRFCFSWLISFFIGHDKLISSNCSVRVKPIVAHISIIMTYYWSGYEKKFSTYGRQKVAQEAEKGEKLTILLIIRYLKSET